MKKIFIGVIIFGLISFCITGALIKINHLNNDSTVIEKLEGDEKQKIKEKTLDLNGRYDENDIEFKKIKVQYDNVSGEIDVPQIYGLKDKSVENKINDDIKNSIENKINDILSSNNDFFINRRWFL